MAATIAAFLSGAVGAVMLGTQVSHPNRLVSSRFARSVAMVGACMVALSISIVFDI